jgi:pyridoxal phosphate-dependent aminotransferase EpsN
MPELEKTYSNRWLTALTFNYEEAGLTSKEVLKYLADENIEARPVWKPLHLQPVFQSTKYYPHSMIDNVSECLFENGLCLPSGSNMTLEEQMRVIQCIKDSIILKRKNVLH